MILKPLVAVGVPVYNGEKYLEKCLESIHNQSYDNWECVIVNNQSTDNSLAIAKKMCTHDSRFKVLTNTEFVDMTTNFNNTYRYASKEAKYFKVVCADDWIFPEFIEQMVNLMEEFPDAGICSSYRIDNTKVRNDDLNINDGPVFKGYEILMDQLKNKYDITGSETTVLYRMEILKKLRGESVVLYDYSSYHFDTSLAYEILNISDLGFIFQVLSYTRRHESTLTSTTSFRFQTSLNFRESELYKYKQLNKFLEQDYIKVREEYGLFLVKCFLKNDRKCLQWHREHLPKERGFKLVESVLIVLKVLWQKIFRKRKLV